MRFYVVMNPLTEEGTVLPLYAKNKHDAEMYAKGMYNKDKVFEEYEWQDILADKDYKHAPQRMLASRSAYGYELTREEEQVLIEENRTRVGTEKRPGSEQEIADMATVVVEQLKVTLLGTDIDTTAMLIAKLLYCEGFGRR